MADYEFDSWRKYITLTNSKRYNKISSITLTLSEALDLYEKDLPEKIKQTLAREAEEIEAYKKDLARAKKLGLI